MALETSGFQLSQFERAPQIPGNIGVVDTKSIYGSVVDALKANEALRTVQAVQATTDAELALAQQKAQTEMGLLGPEAEARRAKAQLFTAGAPFEMGLLESRAGAERAKLGYETALSGELGKPENIAAAARAKTLSSTARGTYELARMAADPTQPKEVREAAAVKIQTIQSANQRFRSLLDAGKVDFHTTNADGTTYVRFRDGSTGIIGFPETYTGNAAAYLSGPIAGGLGAPVTTAAVTPLVPAGTEEIPVGAFAPAATTGAPAARAPGVMLSGVAPGAGGVRAPTKAGLLATQSAVKFGGETSPLAGIEGDEVKKEALSTAAEMGKEARKEIRAQLTNLTSFQTEARKEDDIQKELDALIKDANEKGIMISGGSFFGRGLRALAPGEAKTFKSRLGSVIQFIQLGNMLKLKNASSTGSTGFGSLTEPENKLLQGDYGDLTEPDLPSESLVAGLERAKRGLALRRQEALDTIRGRLAVERGIEQQTSAFFQNAKDRFVIPRHPLEIQEQAAPTRPVLPSLEGVNLFPSRGAITPARLTIGPEPTPEPAPGPHTEGPLTPDETESTDISEDYEQLPAGTSGVSSYPGRMVTPPAAAPAPAAPAPAAPAPAAAPARDANAPASPLLMDFIKRLGEVNPEVAQRRREMAAQTGGTSYAAAGPFAKPIEPAIPESNVRPVGQSTWEAYNERRRRATEAGLPQVALSPQGVAIARELRSQYEAGQRAKQGEQPVVEIMGSDGKRRAFAVEDPTIADALIGILNGQQAPNLEPRLETDREATRQLTEGRMRREELARQLRTIPRR